MLYFAASRENIPYGVIFPRTSFGGTGTCGGFATRRNIRSNSSGSSDAPCSRAASMKRSRWGFSFGSGGFAGWHVDKKDTPPRNEKPESFGTALLTPPSRFGDMAKMGG